MFENLCESLEFLGTGAEGALILLGEVGIGAGSGGEIVQAPLGQLPWYHHLTLLEQLKSRGDRLAYAALAVANGWSRNMMVHQIDLKVADQHGNLWGRAARGIDFIG